MRVIGRVDAKEKYKLELALKYCKAKMTEFRSEERRKVQYEKQLLVNASLHIISVLQVLGHAPYSRMKSMSTPELGLLIMKQIHAPLEVEQTYFRHLAIFVSFIIILVLLFIHVQ